jgi:hypothetical protein
MVYFSNLLDEKRCLGIVLNDFLLVCLLFFFTAHWEWFLCLWILLKQGWMNLNYGLLLWLVSTFNPVDRIWCLWWMLYETDEYWSLKLMFLLNYRLIASVNSSKSNIWWWCWKSTQAALQDQFFFFFLDMGLCMNFSLKFLKNCILKFFLCGTLFMIYWYTLLGKLSCLMTLFMWIGDLFSFRMSLQIYARS